MGNSLWIVALASIAASPDSTPAATSTTAVQVRRSVERGLAYLEKDGLAWLDQRKCVSCHHGPFMLWSFNEARQRGFAVDGKLDALSERVVSLYLRDRKEWEKNPAKKQEAAAQAISLVLAQAESARPTRTPEKLQAVLELQLGGQQAWGGWNFIGQIQDRPTAEANEATTMWAILALSTRQPGEETLQKSRARARAWLAKNQTSGDNESAALRLTLERKFGDPGKALSLLDELKARQNADGGWSWSKKRTSDPYATGQSLYALGLAGLSGDDPTVQKAWKYLLGFQRDNGSWLAPTKKAKGGNDISSFWAAPGR